MFLYQNIKRYQVILKYLFIYCFILNNLVVQFKTAEINQSRVKLQFIIMN